jgi:uncharacterized protein (TIGR01777 family)
MPPATSPAPIAVTGASGLVGRALLPALRAAGHRVIPLVRRAPREGEVRWDPAGSWDAAPLGGVEAVVHLAGEGIADQRWSAARKEAIRRSRVEGTRSLVSALGRLPHPPRTLIAASAMGIYGDAGETLLPESAPPGTDFLGKVAVEWEGEASLAERFGARVAHLRSGIILSPDGGALGRMLPPFRLGVGGPLGSGRQWMSWIAIDDLTRIILTAIGDERYRGPINAVTPHPLTNGEFTRALGQVLQRPALIPVPAFGLRLLFGEMADAALLASQRLEPAKLRSLGFAWSYPEIVPALRHLLQR